MFHKILVAIDHSESSRIVFGQALTLAKVNQTKLLLLHAIAPFANYYPPIPYYVGIPQASIEAYLKRWHEPI